MPEPLRWTAEFHESFTPNVTPIPVVKETKFFGVIFDLTKLLHLLHTSLEEVMKALNLLHVIAHTM